MIKTLQDADREIRQLKYELDRLRSQNIDLGGRRIINAGRTAANSDYITKGEVLDLLRSDPTVAKIDPGWLQIDISVAVPSVGTDVTVRPVVWIPFTEKGIPVLCGARLRTPCDGVNSFTLRWNHYSKIDDNTVDLFNGELLTLAPNTAYSTITQFYPNRNIATQDYFTLDIVSTGAEDEEDESDNFRGAGLYTFLAVMVK